METVEKKSTEPEQAGWGPYQLRPNSLAILRLSLSTAAAISTALVLPDLIALAPTVNDPLTYLARIIGLWGYCYICWAAGFLCLLHMVRILSSGIVLDSQGIKLDKFGKKLSWDKILAVSIAERKIFSKIFLTPAYQMTIHFEKPDGKRSSKQLASFMYTKNEFFSLFYYISKKSLSTEPRSLNAFVFKDVSNSELQKIAEEGKLKRLALTVVIAFGLVAFLGRKAALNYNFNMGNKEFRAANYDRALSYYAAASALEFTFAPAWDRLARCEFRQGDLDAAEEHWKTALKWKPDYVESKLGLSNIYILKGKLQDADQLISSANRLAPFDEAGYINRSQIDFLMGKTTKAIESLEDFIKQREGREQAICLLARYLIKEGQPERAERLLQNSEKYFSDSFFRPLYLMVSAELKTAQNKCAEAEKLLEPLKYSAKQNPDLLIDFARIKIKKGRYEQAKRDLDAAAKINPNGPWINLTRAELELKSGGKDGEKWINQALSFKYEDACLIAAAAQLMEEAGRHEKAVELAKKALAIDPYILSVRELAGTKD